MTPRQAMELLRSEVFDDEDAAIEAEKNQRAAEVHYREALYSPGRLALEAGHMAEVKDDHDDLEARLRDYAADLARWKRLGVYSGPTDLLRVTP